MQIKNQRQNDCKVKLTIELSEQEINSFQQEVVKKLAQNIKVDGFRKGHIPENVLKEKIGAEVFQAEVIDHCINKTLSKAVKKEQLTILTTPKVDLKKKQPLIYEAIFSTFPLKEKIPTLKNITIPKEKTVKVEKKEIEQVKEKITQDFAKLNKLNRSAKKGDFLDISFEGFDEDGVALEGAKSNHHPVIIGSGSLIPGFEDQLIDLKAGSEKEFKITFPQNYQRFAGKKAKFKVKVHDVFEKIIPLFDDNLAQKISGQDKKTAQEIEKDIETTLHSRKKDEERVIRENKFLDNLAQKSTFDLTDELIEKEVQEILQNIKDINEKKGIKWEIYLKNIKKTEDQLKKDLQEKAKRQAKVKISFTLLIEKENITISPQEIEQEIERIIAPYPQDQQKIARKKIKNEQEIIKIISILSTRKFFDQLFKNV